MEVVKERAISRKREYDAINRFVTDRMIKRTIIRTKTIDDQLTLLNCLTSDAPEYFAPLNTLHALDENLKELDKTGAIKQPKKLGMKLLNRSEQFLNTLSELTLARALIKRGYSVFLEEKFFDDKDADIFASYQGEDSYIEAAGLAFDTSAPVSVASEDEDSYIEGAGLALPPLYARSCSRLVPEIGSEDLVVAKIVGKYQNKFEIAYKNGWQGHSWVALDVSKNHEQDISASLNPHFFDASWVENLAKHIRGECPHLTGIIVYSTRPNETHARIICWYPL